MSIEFISPVRVNNGEIFIIPTEIAYRSGRLNSDKYPELNLYVPKEDQLATELFFFELQNEIISHKGMILNKSPESIFYGPTWSLRQQNPNQSV